MAFQLHHVFVCTSPGAPEAETLRAAGLTEGSPNDHPGQGTANRRFFFESGYLELLYVRDELEAQSDSTGPIRLWERWSGSRDHANPFGICFSRSNGLDRPGPFALTEHRPSYLPDDKSLLFADGLSLSEPEIFFLSWPQDQAPPEAEPTRHPLGLRQMTSASIGLPGPVTISESLSEISRAGLVSIHQSEAPELILEFASDGESFLRVPELRVSLIGRPGGVV